VHILVIKQSRYVVVSNKIMCNVIIPKILWICLQTIFFNPFPIAHMCRARISCLSWFFPIFLGSLCTYSAVKSVPGASRAPALVQSSVRGRLRARIQKPHRMPCKGLVELKEGAVARVRISQKDGVRQVLAQPIGVPNRNHLVIDSIYDEGWCLDTF
jgi:hypothetical protein